MKVLVTGGTGYVGQAMVAQLLKRGHEVIVLQRPQTTRPLMNPNQSSVMAPVEQSETDSALLKVVSGDLFATESWESSLQGTEAIIHLVGIIREVPKQNLTMDRIHIEGTQRIVELAERIEARRFLHMSALGARPKANSKYHQSKWAAEELVRASQLDYTIFRPSVIYGGGGPGPNFIEQLTNMIHQAPVTPMIGKGGYRLQPVALSTVCTAFVNALDRPETIGRTYHLGGANVLTYKEILQTVALSEGKVLRALTVPEGLMRVMVNLLDRFPWFPLTRDQFAMLTEGSVCPEDDTVNHDLSLSPQPFHL